MPVGATDVKGEYLLQMCLCVLGGDRCPSVCVSWKKSGICLFVPIRFELGASEFAGDFATAFPELLFFPHL